MSRATTWPVVRATCQNRIDALRDQLEAAAPEVVSRLQGEIAGLRFVLAIEDELSDPEKMIGD